MATDYERAQVRLRAFELLQGWGNPSPTPDAKDLIDRFPIPWNFETRIRHAKTLADWAFDDEAAKAAGIDVEGTNG